MAVTQQARRRTIHLSAAALSFAAVLRCNVYNDSLLGQAELAVGGATNQGHSGGNTASGGSGPDGMAGELDAGSGPANAGAGGLDDSGGADEAGGAGTITGTGGTFGSGGANSGASGAVAATSGTGGVVAGNSGMGGDVGGTAGSGGASQTANGCAKLSVPLDDASDKAHFVITLASAADLSGATISMRYYVQQGQGGTIFNYVQDSGTYHFLGVPLAKRQLVSSGSGWSTVNWNVGAEPDSAGTGIVKTSIKSIGIEINAQPSSSWTNPTIVYVDSITVTTPALSFTFDAASSVATTNANGALWLNSNSQDTTASGSTVTWQATCP
jgi:hypothetical protein